MPKRPIPQLPAADESLLRVLRAMKENLEEITGQRNGKVVQIESTATTSEIIAKLNEIIVRLQV